MPPSFISLLLTTRKANITLHKVLHSKNTWPFLFSFFFNFIAILVFFYLPVLFFLLFFLNIILVFFYFFFQIFFFSKNYFSYISLFIILFKLSFFNMIFPLFLFTSFFFLFYLLQPPFYHSTSFPCRFLYYFLFCLLFSSPL